MMRDDAERTLLFDLDSAIQRLNFDLTEHPAAVQLTGAYHNLIGAWPKFRSTGWRTKNGNGRPPEIEYKIGHCHASLHKRSSIS